MVKDALRVTRRLSKLRGRERTGRPKTFKSEEAAKEWAKEQGITNYQLENLKSPESTTKKIRILVEME